MFTRYMGKILPVVLTGCMLLPLASCMGGGGGGETAGGNTDFVAGNADYETTYYSTKMISIPKKSRFVHGFSYGDRAYFILDYIEYDDSGNTVMRYDTLYVCGYDGQILSEHELEDSENLWFSDVCALDDDRFIVAGGKRDYRIYDYEGHIVSQADSYTGSDCNQSVCRTDDGFVLGLGNKIVKYDKDCNQTGEITIENGPYGWPEPSVYGVFEQAGVCYAYGMQMIDELSSTDYYFKLDFEMGTIEPYAQAWSIAGGMMPDLSLWSADYHRNTCGDTDNGNYILELDMAQQKTFPLADKNNMLICPSSYSTDDMVRLKALDKNHFYESYSYIGSDLDLTEIALIVPDDTINLAERIPVVIQGAGVMNETILKNAAYYYNVSQDEYFIRFDELTSRYAFSTPESMNTTKLQLMAQYNNGNVPDIFYGDFFDYDYMGENGMVADMKPYLGEDPVYDRMTRDDGRMYQVFLGYAINGYFGLADTYGSDVDISSMPDIPDGQSRFGSDFSTDIVYNGLGRDLRRIYRSGDLTPENTLSVVRTAIEQANEPDYEYTNYEFTEAGDVRRGKTSLYSTVIGSPSIFVDMAREFGGTPVFVGYPSLGGSIHAMTPRCQMAVSSATEHPDVCYDFIRSVMTREIQQKVCASGSIPVNRDVLIEMINVLKAPDSASGELKSLYNNVMLRSDRDTGHPAVAMSAELADEFIAAADMADTVSGYDWGLWIITRDEMATYYTQGKSIEEVADALYSRYLVYAEENYG